MRSSFSATVAGEPTSQLCLAQYSGVTSESGTVGSCFRNSVKPNDTRSGRKYSRICRPTHLPGLESCAGPRTLPSPLSTLGGRPCSACACLPRPPVRPDIRRIQVEAHRDEAALAGQLERVRTLADARDSDRRVRLLERIDV